METNYSIQSLPIKLIQKQNRNSVRLSASQIFTKKQSFKRVHNKLTSSFSSVRSAKNYEENIRVREWKNQKVQLVEYYSTLSSLVNFIQFLKLKIKRMERISRKRMKRTNETKGNIIECSCNFLNFVLFFVYFFVARDGWFFLLLWCIFCDFL